MRRLVIKDKIEESVFKKATVLLRVIVVLFKLSMSQNCTESSAELKLADILEEFIFCIYQYEKLDKKIDYFQIAEQEDTSGKDAKSEDSIQLNTPNRNINQTSVDGGGSKYDMCTVVEESNEEDADENSSFRRERKGINSAGFALSSGNKRKMSHGCELTIPSFTSKFEQGEGFDTPVMFEKEPKSSVQKLSAFNINDLLKKQGLQIPKKNKQRQSPKSFVSSKKEGKNPEKQKLITQRNKSKDPSTEKLKHKKNNSKVRMIEKLEKNIFKLIKQAKQECGTPNNNQSLSSSVLGNSEGNFRVIDVPTTMEEAKDSSKNVNRLIQGFQKVSKSLESKLREKFNANSSFAGLNKNSKAPQKKTENIDPDLNSRPKGEEYREKNNISVSFNLDFSKIVSNTGETINPELKNLEVTKKNVSKPCSSFR